MRTYWLTDRESDSAILVDEETVELVLEIEIRYIDWCIEQDGMFENGRWKVEPESE